MGLIILPLSNRFRIHLLSFPIEANFYQVPGLVLVPRIDEINKVIVAHTKCKIANIWRTVAHRQVLVRAFTTSTAGSCGYPTHPQRRLSEAICLFRYLSTRPSMSSSSQTPLQFPVSFPSTEPLVTVSYPHAGLWIIELHNGEDSRLTKRMINDAIRPALDVVEQHWNRNRESSPTAQSKTTPSGDGGEGALIIVGKRNQDKFFSNGFEYESVKGNPAFFTETANPLLSRLLTFPIPTIAAINGHCFAAGMMLALSCDYRIMTDGSRRRAWMCMNEIHFGGPWPLSFTAILNTKVSDPSVRRRIALEGHRFTPSEALTAGLVDRLASCGGTGVELGTENVLQEAVKLAKEISALPKLGVWGSIKTFLYRDCLETVRLDARTHSILPTARL